MSEAVRLQRLATEDVTVEPTAPRIVTTYWARGSDVLDDVLLACQRQDAPPAGSERVPPVLQGLPLVAFDPSYNGGGLWTVTVRYGVPAGGAAPGGGLGTPTVGPTYPPGTTPPATPPEPAAGDKLGREWSFDTGGGAATLRKSHATRAKKSATTWPNPTPTHLQAVNVGPDGVAGCEIVVPKLEFSVTRQVPYLTLGWLQTVYAMTGTVNNATFMGFPGDTAGYSELLFLGASGQGRDDGAWTVTWKFAASKRRNEPLLDNPSDNTQVGGWDFVWYSFAPGVSNGVTVQTPVHVYVERVYEPSDFKQLGVYS